jgi:hypothetical protein
MDDEKQVKKSTNMMAIEALTEGQRIQADLEMARIEADAADEKRQSEERRHRMKLIGYILLAVAMLIAGTYGVGSNLEWTADGIKFGVGASDEEVAEEGLEDADTEVSGTDAPTTSASSRPASTSSPAPAATPAPVAAPPRATAAPPPTPAPEPEPTPPPDTGIAPPPPEEYGYYEPDTDE